MGLVKQIRFTGRIEKEDFMKKTVSLWMVFVLVFTTLVGCAGNKTSPTVDNATTAPTEAQKKEEKAPSNDTKGETVKEEIKLSWALWDYDATPYYAPLIEAFETANPGITIEPVDLGSTDYQTMLSTQLSGGSSAIDLVSVKDIPGYAAMVNAGQLEPLNSYINSAGIDTSAFNGTTEQIIMNEQLYALPFISTFWVIFYNKDLFDKAGVAYPTNDMTFEEYDALARQLTNDAFGTDKVYGSHYHTWRSAVQLFGVLDGANSIVGGNYEFLKPFYEMVLAQQKDGVCQDYAALKTSQTHYSGVFYNNSVAMMNMGTWFISTLIAKLAAGEADSHNWGIVKYPHAEGVEPGTTLGTLTSIAVNSSSKNKEAAFKFVDFISGAEGAKIVASTGSFPAMMSDEALSTIASMEGFPQDENSKEALLTYKKYLEMPVHEMSSQIETVLNEQHDNIMTGNLSIDEGIANMNSEVQKLLGK